MDYKLIWRRVLPRIMTTILPFLLALLLATGCTVVTRDRVVQKSDAMLPLKPAYQTAYPVLLQDSEGNVLPMPLVPSSILHHPSSIRVSDPMAPVSYQPASVQVPPPQYIIHWDNQNGVGMLIESTTDLTDDSWELRQWCGLGVTNVSFPRTNSQEFFRAVAIPTDN